LLAADRRRSGRVPAGIGGAGQPDTNGLSALRNTMPSPGLVVLVVLGVIAAPFLVIFVIASVLAIIKGGLGF
jgi:hypothetical protein